MDLLVSAIVGDLVSRAASFVIGKCFQKQPGAGEALQRARRAVQRAGAVVEEADERRITNRGMLRQLELLRQGVYRGHYMLDAMRLRALAGGGDDHELRCSSSPSPSSRFSPAKRLCFSGTGSSRSREALVLLPSFNGTGEELQRMVDDLESAMDGMKEFLVFLGSYPKVIRQPYGAYLLLNNCMFGRLSERQRVLDFLLRPPAGAGPALAVLPIVGPTRVGKSTLVEHVCRDESVRDRFSTILFFPEDALKDAGGRMNSIDGHVVKHHNCAARRRLLVIVEAAEGIDEGAWSRLKSMVVPCGGGGGGGGGGCSKIIITSRSDGIAKLGTAEALRLEDLPPEAYWHFFKSIAFGAADPEEHPELAAMAMEIASEQGQCFKSARIVAGLLHENFGARSWRMVLGCVRAHKQKNLLLFDEHPKVLMRRESPVYYWRLARTCRYFLVCSHHQLDSTEQVPKISVQDIVMGTGGTLPCGEFEALAWRSPIAPYYSYTASCIVQEPPPPQHEGRRKKQRTSRRRTLILSPFINN